MKNRTRIACLLLGLMLSVPMAAQKIYYMDPEGSDANPGTEDKPFATLVKAQGVVAAGDKVYMNPGTYKVPAGQPAMTYDGSGDLYHCVFHMNRSGEKGKPISYMANPNKTGRPIFDLSELKPSDKRITVFFVTGSNLYFKGFDVIGTQVTITAHTQSECFRIVRGANDNKYEDLKAHDGMAIGFYLTGGNNNHILNCDAYNNYDSVSEGGKGENVDGYGGHINGEGRGTGNVFEGCRAWYNCDDGFDLINCFDAVKIINCWSFLNGYKPGTKEAAGNGTGFKAGGYGMSDSPKVPGVIPRHEVHGCLAYYNRAVGFYANHHLGGITFENNTAINSGVNYRMMNRKDATTIPAEDVKGYGHILKNNLSAPLSRGTNMDWLNRAESEVINNSFDAGTALVEADFISLNEADLMLERKADGSLPNMNFGKLTTDAELRFWGMGCFTTGEPGDLNFGWLKKATIVVVGSKASVVGPEANSFTKMYVTVDGKETTAFDTNSIDLSQFSGVLELKAAIENAEGNASRTIALKIKR